MNYQRYLASREWRVRRRSTIERSKGICERCWGAKANQVHHVTYERIGHELPEDLLALCAPCHQYLSAVTDHDPVASIPTLAGPDDGVMGVELSRLANLEIGARGRIESGDTSDGARLFNEAVGWLADQVREWVRNSGNVFRSLPENQYAIVHASGLWLNLEYVDRNAAEVVKPILIDVGLEPTVDTWRRWRIPLSWLDAAAA